MMGINLKLIIVQGHSTCSPTEFAQKIKLGKIDKSGKSILDQLCFPEDNVLGYGEINGFTIICNSELPMYLIDGEMTRVNYDSYFFESECFPKMPYISLYLQSTINGYGFSVYDGKDQLRSKIGHYDKAPVLEDGDPIPEELSAGPYSENTAGERYYIIDGDHVLEHELGETWIVQLIERFTGMSFSNLMVAEIDEYRITLPV